jgi:SAM-dependent methyltransferase
LYWPNRKDLAGLDILVAGCGTSQAVKYALLCRDAQILGTDITEGSLDHARRLKGHYKLDNLELRYSPLEEASQLERKFDLIVCTGVLHHLADPEAGLRALRDALKPDGRLYLMVYGAYGRVGVYLVQELCRLLGVEAKEAQLNDLRRLIEELPRNHPINVFRAATDDLKSLNGTADALLHPSDRAYTVPQLFEWLGNCGVRFERWLFQAPYLPRISPLARMTAFAGYKDLSFATGCAAMELLRGTMITHRFLASRDDSEPAQAEFQHTAKFNSVTPIPFPGARMNNLVVPKGYAAQLWHPNHGYADLILNIAAPELEMYNAMNGKRTIADIVHKVGTDEAKVKQFYLKLWDYDQVMFCS